MTDKPTVLVVDDEKNILKILRIGLEAIGLSVEAFGNPVAALDALEPGKYDLAFIDLMKPPWTGCTSFARSSRSPHPRPR